MSTFKRAYLFLIRKKGKTVVLLLILTIIATLALTCLSIGQASGIAADRLRESMGGYFKIEANVEEGHAQPPGYELVQNVVDAGGIKAYNGMDVHYFIVNDLQLKPGRFAALSDERAQMARLIANTDSSLHEYFVLRSFALKEGRHVAPTDSYAAVISETLANDNNLSVGDTFNVSFYREDLSEDMENTSMEYEIVGIFEIVTDNMTSSANSAEPDIPENFIFTDTASYQAWYKFFTGGKELAGYTGGAAFFVENPKELDEIVNHLPDISGFEAEAYKIIKNNEAYNHSAVPLERMSGLITIFILIIIILSVVILSLILVMWMRDRKYEIGVFMSLGLKKGNIVLQHIAENLIIAVLAFLLAWGLSGLAAGQIGGLFLDTVVENTEMTERENSGYSMYDDPVVLEDIDTGELLSVSVGAMEFVIVLGIGVLIVLVSTTLSSVPVFKMKPKDVFSSLS